jgi:hypothetical protein
MVCQSPVMVLDRVSLKLDSVVIAVVWSYIIRQIIVFLFILSSMSLIDDIYQ